MEWAASDSKTSVSVPSAKATNNQQQQSKEEQEKHKLAQRQVEPQKSIRTYGLDERKRLRTRLTNFSERHNLGLSLQIESAMNSDITEDDLLVNFCEMSRVEDPMIEQKEAEKDFLLPGMKIPSPPSPEKKPKNDKNTKNSKSPGRNRASSVKIIVEGEKDDFVTVEEKTQQQQQQEDQEEENDDDEEEKEEEEEQIKIIFVKHYDDANKIRLQKRLFKFYSQYNNSKLKNIPFALEAEIEEKEMFRQMCLNNGVEIFIEEEDSRIDHLLPSETLFRPEKKSDSNNNNNNDETRKREKKYKKSSSGSSSSSGEDEDENNNNESSSLDMATFIEKEEKATRKNKIQIQQEKEKEKEKRSIVHLQIRKYEKQDKTRLKKRIMQLYDMHSDKKVESEELAKTIIKTCILFKEADILARLCQSNNISIAQEQVEAHANDLLPHGLEFNVISKSSSSSKNKNKSSGVEGEHDENDEEEEEDEEEEFYQKLQKNQAKMFDDAHKKLTAKFDTADTSTQKQQEKQEQEEEEAKKMKFRLLDDKKILPPVKFYRAEERLRLRQRLHNFYMIYSPQQISNVDDDENTDELEDDLFVRICNREKINPNLELQHAVKVGVAPLYSRGYNGLLEVNFAVSSSADKYGGATGKLLRILQLREREKKILEKKKRKRESRRQRSRLMGIPLSMEDDNLDNISISSSSSSSSGSSSSAASSENNNNNVENENNDFSSSAAARRRRARRSSMINNKKENNNNNKKNMENDNSNTNSSSKKKKKKTILDKSIKDYDEDNKIRIRTRLLNAYQKYCPEKAAHVDVALKKLQDWKEERIFEQMCISNNILISQEQRDSKRDGTLPQLISRKKLKKLKMKKMMKKLSEDEHMKHHYSSSNYDSSDSDTSDDDSSDDDDEKEEEYKNMTEEEKFAAKALKKRNELKAMIPPDLKELIGSISPSFLQSVDERTRGYKKRKKKQQQFVQEQQKSNTNNNSFSSNNNTFLTSQELKNASFVSPAVLASLSSNKNKLLVKDYDEENKKRFRTRLIQFFLEFSPWKIVDVDALLEEVFTEDEIMFSLCQEHNVDVRDEYHEAKRKYIAPRLSSTPDNVVDDDDHADEQNENNFQENQNAGVDDETTATIESEFGNNNNNNNNRISSSSQKRKRKKNSYSSSRNFDTEDIEETIDQAIQDFVQNNTPRQTYKDMWEKYYQEDSTRRQREQEEEEAEEKKRKEEEEFRENLLRNRYSTNPLLLSSVGVSMSQLTGNSSSFYKPKLSSSTSPSRERNENSPPSQNNKKPLYYSPPSSTSATTTPPTTSISYLSIERSHQQEKKEKDKEGKSEKTSNKFFPEYDQNSNTVNSHLDPDTVWCSSLTPPPAHLQKKDDNNSAKNIDLVPHWRGWK